eukprot:3177704-Amphidinium_carterae.1
MDAMFTDAMQRWKLESRKRTILLQQCHKQSMIAVLKVGYKAASELHAQQCHDFLLSNICQEKQ